MQWRGLVALATLAVACRIGDLVDMPPSGARLEFSVQPSQADTGKPITPPVQVTVRDDAGRPDTAYHDSVALELGANPGGALLAGTWRARVEGGIATFANLRVDKPGDGYALRARAPGRPPVMSARFDVDSVAAPDTVPGSPGATTLVFTVQPTTTRAGVTITPAIQVMARDSSGNVATSYAGAITIAIATNPAGGTLAGTTVASASNGVATFGNLAIDQPGSGYALRATAAGVQSATSGSFNITAPPPQPLPARQLAFTVQPGTTQAGNSITPAVQVAARDSTGNVVPGYAGTITIAIGNNPAGGTLSGTTSAVASNGVATFSGLRIDQAGTGYTLTAAASGLTGATSAAFNITAAPPQATQLAFTVQPSTTEAGAVITPAVRVAARDAGGNTVTSFTGTITIAIGTNPAGGTLAGTTSAAASNGIATFAGLRIDRAGSGYTLSATASGLTAATSAPFNITAPPPQATQLAFTVQPSTTEAGDVITPAVQVAARDASGNTVTSFTGTITIAIGTNQAGGTLAGTTSAVATNGVATFSGLRIDQAGTGYTLTAAASGLAGATSAAFNVTAPPPMATQLAFTAQPTNTQASSVITPAVRVAARDANGNVVTNYTGIIAIAIDANPGGGALSGTTSRGAVSGVATFDNLLITQAGSGYTLRATAGSLTPATSAAFNITAPPPQATQLAFTVQPSSTEAGDPIAPAIQVAARDASGNLVASFTGSITIAIGSNPGGGILAGTTSVVASNGVATFGGLRIDRAGSGYTLTAAASGLTGATSASFNITAPPPTQQPTGLRFIVQPSNTGVNQPISPPVQVEVLDQQGVRITTYTGAITIDLAPNLLNATVFGTVTVNAVNGVATFTNLRVNLVGVDYRLRAAFAGQAPIATSNAFVVLL